MFIHSFLAISSLWSIFLFPIFLLVPTITAHPHSQYHYTHVARSLEHPTFHLFPRGWFSSPPTPFKRTPSPSPRTSPAPHRLHRRGLPGAVYICTQANFRGDCAWVMPDNKCHIPGTGDNSPESIGPDPDGYCILWTSTMCDGNQIRTLRFPGLETAVPDFGSIKCYADVAGGGKNATLTATGRKGVTAGADPRLMGGTGSADALALKGVLADMEKEGFSQGMIGLKKGHYY